MSADNPTALRGMADEADEKEYVFAGDILRDAANEIEHLRGFAQFIVDGYANQNLGHVDFRVGAYVAAQKALEHPSVSETGQAE